MKIEPEWRNWQPAGYTDDLGIIADCNQWVNEVLPGWYLKVPVDMAREIHEWCDKNFNGRWKLIAWDGGQMRTLYISDDKDLSWFTLRWS